MPHNWYMGDRGALHPFMADLYFVVNVGAAGALTPKAWQPAAGVGSYINLPSSGSAGIKSITRTGTGAWSVVLDQPYQRLIGINAYSQVAGGLAAAPILAINTSSITSGGVTYTGNVNNSTLPNVNIQFLSAASSAADPGSGEQIVVHLELQIGTGSNA